MKLEIDSIGSNAIQLRIDGEDYSVADIAHMELLELKHVKFAGVAPPHPLIKTVTVQIHTDVTDPSKTLLEALKNSQGKIEELLHIARETFPMGLRHEILAPVAAETQTATIS